MTQGLWTEFQVIGSRAAALLRVAVPMVISRAGIAGMGIADGIIVARHGAGDLAALGLADGTIGRVLDVMLVFLAAGMVLVANACAAGRSREAGAVWRRAVTLALTVGLAGSAAGLLCEPWLRGLGEAPSLVATAAPVVRMLALGMPAALIAIATALFLEAVGRATVVAAAVVLANVLNIGLNWLLIGGELGLPAWGAFGSALSTTAVRLTLAVVLVTYAWNLGDRETLGIRDRTQPRWRGGEAQRRLGYGAAATAAAMNGLAMCLTIFAGWLGTLSLAAVVATWNLLSIGMLVTLGLADATSLRVAAALGRRVGGWADGLLGLALAACVSCVLLVPIVAAPGEVAAMYTGRDDLRAALAALLPLGGLVMVFDGAAVVSAGALRALGDVTGPAAIYVASAVVLVPLAWWIAVRNGTGTVGLMQAILLVSAVRALMLMASFRAAAMRSAAALQTV